MNKAVVMLNIILIVVISMLATSYVAASPSASFTENDGDVFDSWGICRTRSMGADGFYQVSGAGFRPVIAFESLGENTDIAYRLGEQIACEYTDRIQKAEEIFYFVRDRVNYTPDVEQFQYKEFAQNADELATVIERNEIGYGDCEDSAVLLAVMYKGAGYRSAIMVSPGHTAALVYLPNYPKANVLFELQGENGWIWAEVTSKRNPLGWAPKEFINTQLAAYEISAEEIISENPPVASPTIIARDGGGASVQPFPFIGIICLLWFMTLFRRRRSRRSR